MAKPILLINFPNTIPFKEIDEGIKNIVNTLDDYHVLYYGSDTKDFKFEVLNAENLDPIDIKELKEKVNKLL